MVTTPEGSLKRTLAWIGMLPKQPTRVKNQGAVEFPHEVHCLIFNIKIGN